jgi:predicted nucleic acid-binding protein
LLYLDSAVFIYAALSREAIGNRARQVLLNVKDGREEAGSCALTFDEVVWAVQRHRSRDDALAAGQAFVTLPKLTLFPVGRDSLFGALSLMKKYRFDPRDAIHASLAMLNNCTAIVSADTHFDRLKEIPRKPI